MSADIDQKPRVGYNKSMSGQLVASFDLQGNLVLSTLDGDQLNLEMALATLTQERSLNKEIAVVWVPTQQIVISQVKVPGKRKAHWQAALPYSLEEGLTESLDEYHIVAYARDENEMVSVAAVSTQNMQFWIEKLAKVGLAQAQLVPDCFRIPLETDVDNRWLVCQQQSKLVRTGIYQGFAAAGNWYDFIKQQAQQSCDVPLLEEQVPSRTLLSSNKQNLMKVLKQSLSQGDYKITSSASEGWKQWSGVIILSALLIAVGLGMQIMHNQQIMQQAEATKAQTEKLFKTLFPSTKRIVNIKSQTMSKLRQGGMRAEEVEKLTPLLQTIEPWFANNKRVKVVDLKWNQKKVDKLTLEVQAPKSMDIEKLVKLSEKPNSKVKMRLTLKNVTSELAEGVIYVAAN